MKALQNLRDLISQRKNVFLTGGAGVGKSFLLRALIASMENEGYKVAKLASTGMAASLITGQTLHSFFNLGICSHSFDLERLGKVNIDKKLSKLLQQVDLIVIDEISMVSSGVMDMIRLRLLQAEATCPLIVCGDFLQLPPVIKQSEKQQFVYSHPGIRLSSVYGFAFESDAWQRFDFTFMQLHEVKRSSDPLFIHILDQIRHGIKSAEVIDYLHTLMKPLPHSPAEHTFLFGKNASVDRHNSRQLMALEEELFSIETNVQVYEKNVKPQEIERFMADSRLSSTLELKVGAPVLFMRNAWNYFNGQKGTIVRINLEENFIHVLKEDGQLVRVEKERYSKKQWTERSVGGKKEEVEVSRFDLFQYPLTLAYAISIHKSQGMSLLDLIIDMNEIFAPSQFYVALSRAISPQRLALIAPQRPVEHFIFASTEALEFYTAEESAQRAYVGED